MTGGRGLGTGGARDGLVPRRISVRRAVALMAVATPIACTTDHRPDADVYAAVLSTVMLEEEGVAGHPDTFEEQRPVEQLVILASRGPQAPEAISGYAWTRLEVADSSTVADYARRHGDVTGLRDLEGVGPYSLVDENEVRRAFEGGWRTFYERFPGAPGLVRFSGVGFSADRAQAIVYMGYHRAGEWGDGSVYLLEETPDGWSIVDRVSLWQS